MRQWKKFARALRAQLDAEGREYKCLWGAIHFNKPNFDILDKFDDGAFISEIVSAVKGAKRAPHIRDFNSEDFPLLAEHVNHIYLKDTTPETEILWWPAHLQSGVVQDPRNRLVEIVEDKNASAGKYDWNAASEKWLLIYSASDGISDMVGPATSFLIECMFGTSFLNQSMKYIPNSSRCFLQTRRSCLGSYILRRLGRSY